MKKYTKKEAEETCHLHNELFIYLGLSSQKLLCQSCLNSKTEAFFTIPVEIIANFLFLSIEKKHENFCDFLVKNLINSRKFIMRLFLKEFSSKTLHFFMKNSKKILLFNQKNLQKAVYYHKSPFFLLFEYHEFPLNLGEISVENPYFEEILLFLLIKILGVFEYLHDKMGVFHSDFTKDSLRIEGDDIKIIGVIWPFLPENRKLFMQKRQDLRDIGEFLKGILIEMMYKKEGFLWKIAEKCEENDENLSVFQMKKFVEKFTEGINGEMTEGINGGINGGITEEITKGITKGINGGITEKFIEKFNGKMSYFGFKRKEFGKSIDFYRNFNDIFLLNVEISAERELLDNEYQKMAINYENLCQNVCFYEEIDALKIRIFPKKTLVFPKDKWRSFWFFSFYNFQKKTRNTKEIALVINSENEW